MILRHLVNLSRRNRIGERVLARHDRLIQSLLRLIFAATCFVALTNTANAGCPGSLPHQLQNNTTANADDVMGNFNYLLSNCGGSGGTSQWTTSGSNIYYSTGNIGIGTASPTHTLDVIGSLNVSGAVTCGSGCGGGGGSSQWTTSGNNIYYNTGNIGIGTTNPSGLLSVGSSNQFTVDGGGHVIVPGGGYYAAGNTAVNYHTNSLTGIYYEIGRSSVDNADTFLSSPATGYVYFGTAKSGTSQYNGTIVAGSMGIGTTAPSQALSVIGNIYATGNITCGGTCGGGGGQSQWTTSGSNIYYSTGNVGIGTTSPTGALSVVGTSGTNIFTVSDGARSGGVYINGNAVWFTGLTSSVPTVFAANNNGNMAAYVSSGTYFGTYPWTDPGANNVAVAGKLGVGTASPSYTLHVNGTAYATGAAGALSDFRDKKSVAPLSLTALDAVGKLRPVTFFWKTPRDNGMKGRQTGLIAQEVEKVLPSTVLTANDARKSKAIKYDELTAILIKAVQEQQKEIKLQAGEIRKLRAANAKLEARLARIEKVRLVKAD